jgi:hypothetical protein
VTFLKQKLTIQITQLDRIQIDLFHNKKKLTGLVNPELCSRFQKQSWPLTTSSSVKPVRTRFLSNSHPMPPAPTINARLLPPSEEAVAVAVSILSLSGFLMGYF